jgi:hypothetical protein
MVEQILASGAKKAKSVAEQTMRSVRAAMHLG